MSAQGVPSWKAPPYPVPLPGDPHDPAEDASRFARYQVFDDVTVPEGWRVHEIVRWGARLGPADDPDRQIDFGYNNDYTGLLPIEGSDDEHWLFVNHEYLALRPWLASEVEDSRTVPDIRIAADRRVPVIHKSGILTLDGVTFEGNKIHLDGPLAEGVPPAIFETVRDLSDRSLALQGVSILRVRRHPDGRFTVVEDAPDHKRIATQTTQNIPRDAEGKLPFAFTGPAASFLGPPKGTFCNCSGGTTPWGTFLTCEENIQYQTDEEIAPTGELLDGRRRVFAGQALRVNGQVDDSVPAPWTLNGTGHAASEELDGREYGWVCEVDPASGALRKHTALGRFRHENVTVRAEAGKRLAAYMGDDRRGGHVWKFVSEGTVRDPTDPANTKLFETGTLYVARFEPGFTGRWVPLEPETPLRAPEPEHTATHHVRVPSRFRGGFVGIGDTDQDAAAIEVADWQEIIESFAGKPFGECTLGDLVKPASKDQVAERERAQGVICMDAFAMANAAGGTPSARPEDLEVHPIDGSVFVAFTDADWSSDGSPDTRIFPDSGSNTSRQYGAVYRLVEEGDDPAAEAFTWGKFATAGEVAEGGGGFANADNLFFDPDANLWMVTDITTASQNFPTRRNAMDGTDPGGKQFPGVFGNNAMFMLPTQGPDAGVPHLFATGPMECELTGPTFSEDGRTLIISVQHPGEEHGPRASAEATETQEHIIVGRNGESFTQTRTVPVGSNYPSGEPGKAPRPCVVCITRDERD